MEIQSCSSSSRASSRNTTEIVADPSTLDNSPNSSTTSSSRWVTPPDLISSKPSRPFKPSIKTLTAGPASRNSTWHLNKSSSSRASSDREEEDREASSEGKEGKADSGEVNNMGARVASGEDKVGRVVKEDSGEDKEVKEDKDSGEVNNMGARVASGEDKEVKEARDNGEVKVGRVVKEDSGEDNNMEDNSREEAGVSKVAASSKDGANNPVSREEDSLEVNNNREVNGDSSPVKEVKANGVSSPVKGAKVNGVREDREVKVNGAREVSNREAGNDLLINN